MRLDETQIRQWYDVMMAGNLCEIRILTKDNGPTFSGLFDDCESIIRALRQFPDRDDLQGVYYGLNQPGDHCRSKKQYGRILQAYKGEGISDPDIATRRWLLVDLDPVRPSHTSATEGEKANAYAIADQILKLREIGFPNPKLIVDSGNGYHLLYRVDADNTQETADTLQRFLQVLANEYNNRLLDDRGKPLVDLDKSVFNASRISKLPGTWARKGENTPERPHRLSKILSVIPDENCDIVCMDDLRAVIDHFTPRVTTTTDTPQEATRTRENVDKSAILRNVQSCLCQLEAKGVRFPADRDRWHTILCGWFHSLGADGLDSFLRFSAMWENADAVEDRRKYLEIQRYPHDDADTARHPATIQKFYDLCLEYGITPAYDWRKWQVDITQEQPDPIPLITRDGRMFLTRNNLCAIVGRPKAGKSTLLSAIVATAYTGRDCLGFQSEGNFKVVWFDTEQAPDDSTRMWRGAYRLAGIPVENNDNLIFVRLLETPLKERLRCVEAVVKETRPDLVILDGIGDILRNTNDIEESQAIVMDIRRINVQYACGIVAILHVNWRDEKARGHLGTILQHKCESVVLLEHEAGMDSPSKVIPQLTRKAPFAPFSFAIDPETGMPCLSEGAPSTPPAISTLMDCVKSGRVYTHKELVQLMMGKGQGESNAKKYIGVAVEKGYLVKLADGYALNDDDLPE